MMETMSGFEAMDPKMDMRLKRKDFPHPRTLIEKGILKVNEPLSERELAALMDEFFVQMATWQK
jgi:hypothetical protein